MLNENRSYLYLDDPMVDGSSFGDVLMDNDKEKSMHDDTSGGDTKAKDGSRLSSYNFQVAEVGLPADESVHPSEYFSKGSTATVGNQCFRWFFQPIKSKFSLTIFGCESALEKEYQCFNEQAMWIIHPCSHFRLCWAVLMIMLLVVNLTVLPVWVSFFVEDLNLEMILFNCVFDVAFVLDIIVNFRTGIILHDSTSTFVVIPKRIAEQYLKTWFTVDVASSIPFDYIFLMTRSGNSVSQFINAGRALRILRITKILSLTRLLRLCRLIRYLLVCEQSLSLSRRFKPLINLVLLILLSTHWLACSQFFVAMILGFPTNSWVILGGIQDSPFADQYSLSFFKATSHMISLGYGQNSPLTISDSWITTITMTSGAIFGTLLVALLVPLVIFSNLSDEIHEQKLKQIEMYATQKKIPKPLRSKMMSYYGCCYRGNIFKESEILQLLSDSLKKEILNFRCGELLKTSPFFSATDQNFLSDILISLNLEIFQAGDTIIREGTLGVNMYFLEEGVVSVVQNDGEVVSTLSGGSNFGALSMMIKSRRMANVRAKTCCNIYTLARERFLWILENYPREQRNIEEVYAQSLLVLFKSALRQKVKEMWKDDLARYDGRTSCCKSRIDEQGSSAIETRFQRIFHDIKRRNDSEDVLTPYISQEERKIRNKPENTILSYKEVVELTAL